MLEPCGHRPSRRKVCKISLCCNESQDSIGKIPRAALMHVLLQPCAKQDCDAKQFRPCPQHRFKSPSRTVHPKPRSSGLVGARCFSTSILGHRPKQIDRSGIIKGSEYQAHSPSYSRSQLHPVRKLRARCHLTVQVLSSGFSWATCCPYVQPTYHASQLRHFQLAPVPRKAFVVLFVCNSLISFRLG